MTAETTRSTFTATRSRPGLPSSVARACTILALPLALVAATPLPADQVVHIERHSEMWSSGGDLVLEGTEEGTLYLGNERARFDQGPKTSWIFQGDQNKLLLLDHDRGTVQEIRLPVRLEDYFEGEDLKNFEVIERRVAPEVETVTEPERKEIGDWSARRVTLRGTPPESETLYEYELWITLDLPINQDLHGELLQSFGALHLPHRDIARQIAGLDGFPIVRRSVVRHKGGSKDVDVRRVTAVTRDEVPADTYEAPGDYRQIPFDPTAWVELTSAEPER